MNIINKICEMHENDYNVMSDEWMDPVHLEFGESIPAEFRDRVEQALDRLDVEVDPYDSSLNLKLELDADGTYRLSQSGELLYRFDNKAPGFLFPKYVTEEAIAWTIFAIVSEKEKVWFRNASNQVTRGAFVSCRAFSAKQQAVAFRIMKSVSAQSVSEIPIQKVTSTLEQIMIFADPFAAAVPMFSCRPILESAYAKYREYRNKPVEKKMGEIAEDLFGSSSFEQEITAYREYVVHSQEYAAQMTKAQKELTNILYGLPIMAVSRFFTDLNEAIASMNTVSLSQIEDLLDVPVRFNMTQDKLKSTFAGVDAMWTKYAQCVVRQDFLRKVWEKTKQSVDGEQLEARKVCKQMRRELSRFCFVDAEAFGENANDQLLGWKQLVNLQERELSMVADLRWSPESMIRLQRKLMNPEQPTCWLCPPQLREQSVRLQITDQFDTQAVPLMDQRCVIALWVRAYSK